MKRLILKPINYDFEKHEDFRYRNMDIWECEPDHLPRLMRHEYKFMRKEGASRRAARWHVHRMLAFTNCGWQVKFLSGAYPRLVDCMDRSARWVIREGWCD